MKQTLKRRICAAILCHILLLGLAGCGKANKAKSNDGGDPPVKASVDALKQGQPAADSEETVDGAESLARVRGDLEYDGRLTGAAAYLGLREKGDQTELTDWLRENCADLTSELPFLLEIPSERDALIKKGEDELENARRQAHDLMQQVQNEAYSLTDELRRIQKDEKTSAAQRAVRAREIARKDTEALLKKTDAKPQPVKEFVPLKEVQIGQEVVIADLGQTATVTARPDRNGMVEVRAGIMKTKVPLSNLRAPDKMEKRKPAEPRRSTHVQLDKTRKTSMELNLLGYTVDEALNEVDKFLDSGMLRGQSTLYIIHGNGTGALRTAIQKHLRTHKAVKSFRLGRYGEGESGVTVVELK